MTEYIKRSDAIKAVDNLCHVYFPANKAKLEAIPAVDVAPVVHGKWIVSEDDNNVFGCSECHHFIFLAKGSAKQNFCPNCGADMRGET